MSDPDAATAEPPPAPVDDAAPPTNGIPDPSSGGEAAVEKEGFQDALEEAPETSAEEAGDAAKAQEEAAPVTEEAAEKEEKAVEDVKEGEEAETEKEEGAEKADDEGAAGEQAEKEEEAKDLKKEEEAEKADDEAEKKAEEGEEKEEKPAEKKEGEGAEEKKEEPGEKEDKMDGDYVLVEKPPEDAAIQAEEGGPSAGDKRPLEEHPHIEEADGPSPKKKRRKKGPPPPPPPPPILKPYGLGGEGKDCDVCFCPEADVDDDGNLPRGEYPLIKCRGCDLLAHYNCYAADTAVDVQGYFACNVCVAFDKEKAADLAAAKSPKGKGKKGKKKSPKKTTPKRATRAATEETAASKRSPKPLPPTAEAQGDGRCYPLPPYPRCLDVYCQLCLRRDVCGGMKPTMGNGWCHLSCAMSTEDVFVKKGRITGIPTAIKKSKAQVKKTMEQKNLKQIVCECCQIGGGLLTRCAYNYGTRKRPCDNFMHPLCAELSDRERVIDVRKDGDIVLYKCAFHSFGEDALCKICKRGSRQNMMLECDGCGGGYHMDCVTPKIEEVPEGEWFCPVCRPEDYATEEKKEEKATEEGEEPKKEEGDEGGDAEGGEGKAEPMETDAAAAEAPAGTAVDNEVEEKKEEKEEKAKEGEEPKEGGERADAEGEGEAGADAEGEPAKEEAGGAEAVAAEETKEGDAEEGDAEKKEEESAPPAADAEASAPDEAEPMETDDAAAAVAEPTPEQTESVPAPEYAGAAPMVS